MSVISYDVILDDVMPQVTDYAIARHIVDLHSDRKEYLDKPYSVVSLYGFY